MGKSSESHLGSHRAPAAWPKVGIVTVNWNGWRDTVELLDSLQQLTYPNFVVVVVDNGSGDGSETLLRERYPTHAILQTGRNLGYPGGANTGVRSVLDEGVDFVWFLNNDTIVDPNALTALVQAAQENSRVGLVGSVVYYYGEPKRIQCWGGAEFNRWMATTRYLSGPRLDRLHYVSGASLLVRTAVFKDVGLLNEHMVFYWDDVDFSLRARRAGWHLAVAGTSYVFHKEGHTVGRKSPRADFLETESLTVFLFENYGVGGLLPLTVRMIGKFVNRIARRQPQHLWNICRGLAAGIRRVFRPDVGIQ